MDLKFTFGGASPDHHDHGDAPSGIPLPFSTTPAISTSSVLELRVRRSAETPGALLGEVVTGDGVVYTSAEVTARGADPAGLAAAARSAMSRAIAGLEGPLAESVESVALDLGGGEVEALAALGIVAPVSDLFMVDAALQRRVGVSEGTPIRIGA
ncbi:hypothetical protein MUN77_09705 [Leucobacter allii]|uniref:hypothetical protein n=1 Tax=Leucobacter allii TaxID=2932247 RepID=UPI001FCF8FF5|nr:hypothetical protein [Leucobacter allii]UOR00444.1 hypothetical protein MUN77_09705 [Leucobacter allii]